MNDRKTRRFKERRSMFPFGQLMLPIIGVVAIGLLVIGIKLFFFPGPETSVAVVIQEKTPQTATSKQKPEPDSIAAVAKAKTDVAQPVEVTQQTKPVQTKTHEAVLAVPVSETAQSAPRIEPSQKSPVKPVKAPETKTVTAKEPSSEQKIASGTSGRQSVSTWGVQIGAFTAKGSAAAVLSKVKAQGFIGELNQAQVNGKVFYRVRVPSGNSRESASTMAQKLKDKGYPTIIVSLVE